MLFTRKGDDGKTKLFGSDQRLSKSSPIAEALGSLDEINSFLGIVKSKVSDLYILNERSKDIINRIQNNLFIIQAQVAGADKKITEDEIYYMETFINNIEKELPPITTFLIPGANETSALFDFSRTLARRAERRIVWIVDKQLVQLDAKTLVYINRLSSLLYACARYTAQESGVESAPKY